MHAQLVMYRCHIESGHGGKTQRFRIVTPVFKHLAIGVFSGKNMNQNHKTCLQVSDRLEP
jgi:hypothetical protein